MAGKIEVYLWGLGKNYKIVTDVLDFKKTYIKGNLDINYREIKECPYGEILPPQILMEESFDYVIVTAKRTSSMIEMYRSFGLPMEKLILFWQYDKPNDITKYGCFDLTKWTLFKQRELLYTYELRLANAPFEYGESGFSKIGSAIDLLREIISERKSLSRFGDGEFELMRMNARPWFQLPDAKLSERMLEVIKSDYSKICLAIPDYFGDLSKFEEIGADSIRRYLVENNTRSVIHSFLSKEIKYFDAYVTRPYLFRKEQAKCKMIFDLWKNVWQNRDVIIFENKYSFMGIGNDLLADCHSIKRIICPEKDAFDVYDDILKAAIQWTEKDDLLLISLGPTATVLAYDLAVKGFQAIDVGHLDKEYDWYLMGADDAQMITGKLMPEVCRVCIPKQEFADERDKEVICRVGIYSN